MDISVWAPDAHNVYAIVDNRRIALQAKPDGTWHINLAPGTQYFYNLTIAI